MTQTIGRNEPCPCGSGKKYKRCCGVSAAPKLTETKKPVMDPSALPQFDPQMMMQLSEAMKRLPKGQLQRLQALMQKAMSGKDITGEAQEFEKNLPMDFQNLLKSFPMAGLGAQAAEEPEAQDAVSPPHVEISDLEQAKAIVEKAASEGKISKEEAGKLLEGIPTENSPNPMPLTEGAQGAPLSKESKLGKFWKNLSGRKNP